MTSVRNVITLYSEVNASITVQTGFKYEVDPTYPINSLRQLCDLCTNQLIVWYDGYVEFKPRG